LYKQLLQRTAKNDDNFKEMTRTKSKKDEELREKINKQFQKYVLEQNQKNQENIKTYKFPKGSIQQKHNYLCTTLINVYKADYDELKRVLQEFQDQYVQQMDEIIKNHFNPTKTDQTQFIPANDKGQIVIPKPEDVKFHFPTSNEAVGAIFGAVVGGVVGKERILLLLVVLLGLVLLAVFDG